MTKNLKIEKCRICEKEICSYKLACIVTGCKMAAHVECLAREFLVSAKKEKSELRPVEGKCPACSGHLFWNDLVRNMFREKWLEEKMSGKLAETQENEEEEDEEDDIASSEVDEEIREPLRPLSQAEVRKRKPAKLKRSNSDTPTPKKRRVPPKVSYKTVVLYGENDGSEKEETNQKEKENYTTDLLDDSVLGFSIK